LPFCKGKDASRLLEDGDVKIGEETLGYPYAGHTPFYMPERERVWSYGIRFLRRRGRTDFSYGSEVNNKRSITRDY